MMFVNKTPSKIILFLLVICLILLATLIPIFKNLYLHSCSVNFGYIKKIHDNNNFWNTILDVTIMHHIISCHSSVHGVASWSGICRLTNRYAFECNIVGCLQFPLTYPAVAGTIGLLLLISRVVMFSHVTLMPRRNLDSRVRCSHMIELLGARWCLGMCDVTHCNLLLCNLTSVLTSDPYSSV